jgi:hypothetical protein
VVYSKCSLWRSQVQSLRVGFEVEQKAKRELVGYLPISLFAYQQTGRPEKAKRAAKQLLAARPNFTVAAWFKIQISRDGGSVRARAWVGSVTA